MTAESDIGKTITLVVVTFRKVHYFNNIHFITKGVLIK